MLGEVRRFHFKYRWYMGIIIDAEISNGAKYAYKVISEAKVLYSSFEEYFADVANNSFDGDAVLYNEDGNISIKYKV